MCKKNMYQKIQRDDKAKKGIEKQEKKILAVSNAKHSNVNEGLQWKLKYPK